MSDVSADAVVVGHLSGGDVKASFFNSWDTLRIYDLFHGQRTYAHNGGGRIHAWAAAGTLEKARNELAAMFLDDFEAPWFMWFDSDMGFEADTIDRLVEAADPDERPVVGALCFAQRYMGYGECWAPVHHLLPTVFQWVERQDAVSFQPIYDYPRNQLFRCSGTGSAAILIHRRVLEAVRDKFGDHWYDKVVHPKNPKPFGEDLSFCIRIAACDFPLHVHSGIKTAHVKENHALDEQLFDTTRERASSHKTFVVIPVKDQLEHTKKLVGQLEEQGGYDRILIYDNNSGAETRRWLQQQQSATVFDATGANIHEMWNAGVNLALEQDPSANIVFLNNDLELGDDFLDTLCHDLRSDPHLVAISPNYDSRDIDGVEKVHGICANRYDGTGGLAGFAFAVRGEWFVSTGYRFPEDLNWWYGDNDLCMSMEMAGAEYGITGNTTVVHVDGGQQTERPDNWDELVEADKKTFYAKWFGDAADA